MLGIWCLEFGIWDLEFGIWNLEFGAWNLEFGAWDLGFGIWDLGFGIWDLEFGAWNLVLYFMWNNIYKVIVGVFIVFWVGFIFLDYWQNHLQYIIAFHFFRYLDLTVILALLGAGVTGAVIYAKKSTRNIGLWVNGLSVFLLGLLIILGSVYMFQRKVMNVDFPVPMDMLRLSVKMFLMTFYTYFIVVSCHALGMYMLRTFRFEMSESARPIVAIAAGIMTWVAVMFVLGIFSLLHWYVLLGLMLVAIVVTGKEAFPFIWKTLFAPLSLNGVNTLGIASFYILLIVVSLNLLQITIPIPRGWDSVSLYLNVCSLINDYAGLVQGHQPYNWSLFMSLGFIIFDKAEMALSLSFLGGVLSLFALFYLCKNWLKMNVNYALLCVLMFYLIPSIAHQSYLDLKVDLGLLFILLTIVILLIEWQQRVAAIPENAVSLSRAYIILIGLFSGFAIGIKLTALMAFFAVTAVIWWIYNGKTAFLAVFFMMMFAVLLLKLDDMPQLRQFHLQTERFMWIMLALGLVFFVWTAIREREKFLPPLKLSILYTFFFILPIAPWLTKNYIETGGELSTRALTYGKTRTPATSIQSMQKNWEEKYKKPKRKKKKKKRKQNK